MLAYKYDPDKHDVDGWWVSEKFNGVRGLWDGKQMMSRNKKPFALIPAWKAELAKYPSLDGEIWFGYDTFDICSGELRNHAKTLDRWKNAKYMVFDIPDTKLPFEERQAVIKDLLRDPDSFVQPVKYIRLKIKKLPELLSKIETRGGEGLMLRRPESMYTMKRSYDMLKVKSWDTNEAVVVDYVMGEGRLKGLVGSLVVTNNAGKTFKVGAGMLDAQRDAGPAGESDKPDTSLVDAYRVKKGLQPVFGTKIVYKFKELTKTGTPLFPTYAGIYV